MAITFITPGSRVRHSIYGVMKVLTAWWCASTFRVEVRGREHIPGQGPVIILPKHQYWTDIPLIGYAFYNIQLNYIAKQELFRIPLISYFLMALGGFPLIATPRLRASIHSNTSMSSSGKSSTSSFSPRAPTTGQRLAGENPD